MTSWLHDVASFWTVTLRQVHGNLPAQGRGAEDGVSFICAPLQGMEVRSDRNASPPPPPVPIV